MLTLLDLDQAATASPTAAPASRPRPWPLPILTRHGTDESGPAEVTPGRMVVDKQA
jgi:hypothetical protein